MSPVKQEPVRTREEAIERAMEWATGKRSHMGVYGAAGYDTVARMNAAEVAKFSSLAAVLPEARNAPDTERIMAENDILNAALAVIEGYAHYSYGTAGKIAVDFLVERGIWSPNTDTRERLDPVYEVAAQLVKLIVIEMQRATNEDQAADAVGDAEEKVWSLIEAKAKVLSEYLDRSMRKGVETDGARAIELERREQVARGFTFEHDDGHNKGELIDAAICYALARPELPSGVGRPTHAPPHWPWVASDWHPHPDQRRNLVKAGALIAAEIDRLDRITQDAYDRR